MDEHAPVDSSEFVYRRVHPNYFKSHMAVVVRAEAFRPTEADTSGLSVLRALFAQPHDTLPNLDPEKASGYRVARLGVQDLLNLGLTVVPDPLPGGPLGHAIIPELSWQCYQVDKQRWKPVLVELAKLASAAIVHPPSPPAHSNGGHPQAP